MYFSSVPILFSQRSDYLHRNLYETFSDFPNVYFPTWRIATIWGGASLLQMLLRALEDLEYILTGWRWDYFINLSESDYPLRFVRRVYVVVVALSNGTTETVHFSDKNTFYLSCLTVSAHLKNFAPHLEPSSELGILFLLDKHV